MERQSIIFVSQGTHIEVKVQEETVWLTAEKMAKLFGRSKSVISRHIKNVLLQELDKSAVKIFANVRHYNLDVIISVGYRVKSRQGVTFRKWATSVLQKHLAHTYILDQRRLEILENTTAILDIANRKQLSGEEAIDIIKVVTSYSKALDMLDAYDRKSFHKVEGKKDARCVTYSACLEVIRALSYTNSTRFFALERDRGLEGIIHVIYQSFAGKELYETVEDKAANFLYLVVKNHVFVDGNKRIAAALFVYFLNFYGMLYKENGEKVIHANLLAAITLLVAQSSPAEKEILIDLIKNFLVC